MQNNRKSVIQAKWILKWIIVVGIILLAMALRGALFSIRVRDYNIYMSPWYDFIHSHGGFAALKYNFSNYPVSYLYLLAIATYIPLSKIVIIKSISVFFDLLLALFTYLIVRLKYEKSYLPIIAALLALFTPTVFLNSSLWGQSDSIYASCSLGGLYFLLHKQPLWAFLLFGLAFSFKLQAVFLFPLLLVLLITRKIHIQYFLIIPAVYLITLLPAWLIGANFMNLLTMYSAEVNHPPQSHFLTLGAPNIFQWIPVSAAQFDMWKNLGILLALSAVAILSFVVRAGRRKITNDIMLRLALVFVLVTPFLLPEMHERYFYLADIISLIYVFYFPDYFYIAILIELSSLLSYIPYLMGVRMNQQFLAVLIFGVIIITSWDLVKLLFSTSQSDSA